MSINIHELIIHLKAAIDHMTDDQKVTPQSQLLILSSETLESIQSSLAHLLPISQRLHTQDNRSTDNPLFIVQEKRFYGCDPDEGDYYVWLDESSEQVDDETSEMLEELDDIESWELTEEQERTLKKYHKRGIKYYWDFCMAAFTEEGCKQYLERNAHNLKEPRSYAESWNRCPEMLAIRQFLMSLTPPPTAAT